MLLVVMATALRPALKEDAVMGVEYDKDEELTDKRDDDEDYDKVDETRSRIKLDVDNDNIKPGRDGMLSLCHSLRSHSK